MAERDSVLSIVQSGQSLVGSALTGGGAAVAASNDNASTALLEDLRSIGRENEKNTETLVDTFRQMFAFDKNRFARERDQARELEKEKREVTNATGAGVGIPSASEMTGGLGPAALAGIAALAYFAKDLGANTDILKLPQQLKSIRAMANFAKGIGTIATVGFGPAIVRDVRLVVGQFGTNISNKFKTSIAGPILSKFDEFKKGMPKTPFGGAMTFFDDLMRPVKNFFSSPTMIGIGKYFDEAGKSIAAVFAPFKNSFMALFGSAKEGGKLAQILEPLKKFGRAVGKLFLPVTIILGIFDGVSGFMKEYEETGKIVDGIRGAVVGIIDGFIGSFVRLITDLLGAALSYLGLENLGQSIINFGNDVTKHFGDAIGGIVDFVTGIFTFDGERILGGLAAMFTGVGGFFATVLTTPINMAVNFVKDLFGWGDPGVPFDLMDEILGVAQSVMDWFRGIFTFDLSAIKQKIFDVGLLMKAMTAGGVAAVKAIAPGGESPAEAYTRVYNETIKTGQAQMEADQADAAMGLDPSKKLNPYEAKMQRINQKKDRLALAEAGAGQNTNVIYNDNSNKQVSNQNMSKNETYTGKLDTGIDSYHDRNAFAFGVYG